MPAWPLLPSSSLVWLQKINFLVIFFLGRQLTPSRYKHGCCWSSFFPLHGCDLSFLQPCGCPSRDHLAALGLTRDALSCSLLQARGSRSLPCDAPGLPRAAAPEGQGHPAGTFVPIPWWCLALIFLWLILFSQAGLGKAGNLPWGSKVLASGDRPSPAQCMAGRCCSPQDHAAQQHTPALTLNLGGFTGHELRLITGTKSTLPPSRKKVRCKASATDHSFPSRSGFGSLLC